MGKTLKQYSEGEDQADHLSRCSLPFLPKSALIPDFRNTSWTKDFLKNSTVLKVEEQAGEESIKLLGGTVVSF